MEKPAETDHPVHELIRRRWSPRTFSDREVEPETIRSLLEAARWAPSSFNEQPWRFVVATSRDPEAHERMVEMLVEGNQRWAADAPVLMISFAKTDFDKTGKPNAHARHDVGQAAAQLTLEALDRGLFVHQMAGIHDDAIVDTYDVPEAFEPVAGFAIGYPGDPDDLPDDLAESERSERSRHPQSEIVFGDEWGESKQFEGE
jgi:nitroreductase